MNIIRTIGRIIYGRIIYITIFVVALGLGIRGIYVAVVYPGSVSAKTWLMYVGLASVGMSILSIYYVWKHPLGEAQRKPTTQAEDMVFELIQIDGATNYELQVARDGTFRKLVIDRTSAEALRLSDLTPSQTHEGHLVYNVPAVFLTLTESFDSDKVYHWRVRANTPAGVSTWRVQGRFTIIGYHVIQQN